MQQIIDAVSQVRIGTPQTFKNLTIFPLLGSDGAAAVYITLDEALAHKCAAVTEMGEAGSVPELKFVNSGDKPVFLMDGEELIGAKQNRVLNLSILAAAGKTIVIPVSCVEAGRWHRRSREFSSAPRAYYAEGRARKMAQVSMSMKSAGSRHSDQSEVWRSISRKFEKLGLSSATAAMSDMYEQAAGKIEDYVRAFPAAENQVGAMFAIDGRMVGFDLFDSRETLKKLLPKLLRSYALDAIDALVSRKKESADTPPPSESEAQAFLTATIRAREEIFPAVGDGRDVRLESGGITGAALALDDRVVHLSAFAVPGGPA